VKATATNELDKDRFIDVAQIRLIFKIDQNLTS
jgi:hypothetical protein